MAPGPWITFQLWAGDGTRGRNTRKHEIGVIERIGPPDCSGPWIETLGFLRPVKDQNERMTERLSYEFAQVPEALKHRALLIDGNVEEL